MNEFANRMKRLGTETAYAVSGEAMEHSLKGNKVYPFHLGDINIITSPNIIKTAEQSMKAGKTGYCPAAGIKELREAMAADINKGYKTDYYNWENVSIQSGGKPVIGKFIMSLMNEGDEVLYPSPGYPIYESQVGFYGGIKKPYKYLETPDGFSFDMDYFKSLITPKTKLFIYNNYQNPMGVCSSYEEMEELARLAVKHDWYVLADDAYFDMVYPGTEKLTITQFPGMKERTVILYTFSKKFAMTGWRLGAAIGPKDIINAINKINTNDEACTTHFVQYAGIEALQGDQTYHKNILKILEDRLNVLFDELKDCPGIKIHKPTSTFYLFTNVTEVMRKMNIDSVEKFRKVMLDKTGVSFTTRNHFGDPLEGETEKYIRFAYSGIEIPEIKEGISKFKEYIKSFY